MQSENTERTNRGGVHFTHGFIVAVYLILLAVGIPWYWSADDDSMLLGFPAWTAVALATSVLASIVTAMLIAFTWDDDLAEDPPVEKESEVPRR